jgi:GNAT superfamily N-acetyltransferase
MRSLVAFTAECDIAGEIRWSTRGGEIALVWVPDSLQRRGIATALLSRAVRCQPDVHHSSQLTDDARAWIEGLRASRTPKVTSGPSGEDVRLR